MGDEVTREFKQLRLSKAICAGLREIVRPPLYGSGPPDGVEEFCRRLYRAYYSFEADPDLATTSFTVNVEDLMIINHYVSAEDGDWAADILHQTRQVLYEMETGKEAVRLASSADVKRLMGETKLDPEAGKEVPEADTADEEPQPEGEKV